MIFVTGDIHADIDIGKLSSSKFVEGNNLTKKDYLIICGDFGLVWDNPDKITKSELWWTKWLNEKPWTTLFIDGNHENHDRLDSYAIEEKFGGKVHRITDSIYHLMRGQYYTIEEKTFWTMGGATSHDKIYRKEGISWWRREVPSLQEELEGIRNLELHGNKVDYIITHCLPKEKLKKFAEWYENDSVTSYLQYIKDFTTFNKWYCGHYHVNMDLGDGFQILYNSIEKII